MIGRLSCVAVLGLVAAGCTSAEAREDRAILQALDVLRDSSPDDLRKRHELIDALAKLPATSALGRESRDACADAYRLMAEGKEGTMKVKAELERPGAALKNAVADLAAAEEKIKKAEPAMQDCQKAAAELSIKRKRR